ncbi:hypothetical protein VDP59_016640 [Xanthomonas campestris pv. campestris]|uniref:hypothetical protein n=1 Tax=Xanthomonas campestris TaxID=339 RepID=UPI002AD44B35|nr:hypothetical protein [Xanthomonas campestris]MEA0761501.1 hypothetical protein [Xanthomonas campestris pv. campestris]MEB1357279.1 hypothetical protein [Xanthomonas campestris pv. campestris]
MAVTYDALPANQEKISNWVKDEQIDAVLIDYNLRKGNFSTENGIVIAARLFRQMKPTVLTTVHKMADIEEGIWLGRYVPALLNKSRMSEIESALSRAVDELQGKIRPERKAYRTIVRVENIDQRHANLVILAHDPHATIVVSTPELKKRLNTDITPGTRFKAEVNIGAATI